MQNLEKRQNYPFYGYQRLLNSELEYEEQESVKNNLVRWMHARIQCVCVCGGDQSPIPGNIALQYLSGFPNHKATKPILNVGASSARQRNAI